MVLVDIYVPSLDKTYNFSLNEKVSIHMLLSEITEMIEQKEHVVLKGDSSMLRIYNCGNGSVLSGENCLADCMVRNGSKLLLV